MPRHSVFAFTLAVSLAGLLATTSQGQNPEFRSRMAAWQQPQSVRAAHAGGGSSYDPSAAAEPASYDAEEPAAFAGPAEGCGNCVCDGSCGGTCAGDCGGLRGFRDMGKDLGCFACMSCRPPMWWLRSDGLLWWRKGRDLPVLVTSSESAVPPPGEIVLYGGEIEGGSPQGGARIDFGTWLGPDECLGIGGRFWGIGKERLRFDADSDSLPDQTIERPFIDANGDPDSLVVADPFTPFDGSISVVSSSEVFGVDAYARLGWCRMCDFRVDLIGGYQFSRINEELLIDSSTQNATLLVSDNWVTRNEFHGGSIGILYESCRGCWTTTALVKVGLGTMRQTVEATGFENGQPGGLLVAEPVTITRDEFAAVPELDVAWSYAINDCWNMNIGYSLMYWSSVARPESMIDFVQGDDVSVVFRDESFWVQGLTIGANCRF
jgi:putative beta barrel porin BBP7